MKLSVLKSLVGLYLFGLSAIIATADPPKDKAPFPQPMVIPDKMPAPKVGTRVSVMKDMWYVFERDVDCSVKTYPPGLVTVEKQEGPQTIRGVFADTNKSETRKYTGKYIYTVTPIGKGTVYLETIPYGFKTDAEAQSTTIDVTTDTTTVCPDPKVDPVDPPKPKPVDVKTFRVIFIYESAKTLPSGQVSALYAKDVEDYLNSKCTKDDDHVKGQGWRRHDKDDPTTSDTKTFNGLWEATKPSVTNVPCVAIEVNGKVTIETLPADKNGLLTLLKTYAEGK